MLLVGLIQPAAAQTIYFDTNGATSGSGAPATNSNWTWGQASGTVWSTSSAGTSATNTWGSLATTASATAVFSAGSDATNAFNVNTTGTITNVGGITFDEGNVTINGSGTLTLSQNANFTANANGTISAIVGDGASTFGITKLGTGTLTLSGANTFSGNVTITAGTLNAGSSTGFGNGTIVLNGGTIGASGGAQTLSNSAISLAGNSTIGGSNNLTLSGTLTNTSGANRMLTVSNSGTTTIGAINLANSSTNRTLTIAGAGKTVVSGTIANGSTSTASAVTMAGSGSLTLTGNNTFGGGIALNSGTLNINSAGALGTGRLTLAAGATIDNTSAGAVTNSNNNVQTWNGAFNYGGTKDLNLGTGAVTLGANVTINAGASGNSTLTVGGAVSGGFGITKTGNGTVALNGANSFSGNVTVSGGTLAIGQIGSIGSGTAFLDGGTLQYTGGAVSTSKVFTLTANGGTIDASGTGLIKFTSGSTIGRSGTGTRTLTLAGTTGTTSAANEFDNVIADPSGGVTNVVKDGTGVWMFNSGSANTYSGNTTVNNGTLLLSQKSGRNATGTGNIIIGDGVNTASVRYFDTSNQLANSAVVFLNKNGTFDMNGFSDSLGAVADGTLTSGGYGTVSLGNATLTQVGTGAYTFNGAITGGGIVNWNGTGTWTIGGNSTFTGGLNLNAGQININSANALGAGRMTIASGTSIDNTSGSAVTVSSISAQTWSGSFTFDGSNDLSLGTSTVTMGGNLTLTANGVGKLTVAGVIDDGASNYRLTKAGTGTLVLSGTNSYSGGTTISGGALQIGAGGTTGNLGTGTVTDNGTLVFNRSDTPTVSNVISGAGNITQAGTGTLTLSGANSSFTGAINVNQGTLVATNASSLGTNASTTVASGATLGLSGGITTAAGNVTLNGSGVSGTGALNNVSGANTLTGNVVIASDSTIATTAGNLTLTGAINMSGAVGNNTVLTFKPAAGTTISASNIITDSLSASYNLDVTHAGAGTVVLSGTNSYMGNTTVGTAGGTTSGTLQIASSTALPTSGNNYAVVRVYSGTLALTGGANGEIFGAQSTLALGGGGAGSTATVSTGTGTLTLDHDLSFDATNNANGASITGKLALTAGTHLFTVGDSTAAANDLTISALISDSTDPINGGPAGFNKLGNGRLVVSGANTYTQGTVVQAGTLTLQNNSALGAADIVSGGVVTNGVNVNSGAILELTNAGGSDLTITNKTLTLSGNGGGNGALRNVAGNNTWSGSSVNLATANTRIQSDSGTLTISNGLVSTTTGGSLEVGGAGNVKISSQIGGNVTGITKKDSGSLTLSGANSFNGPLNVQAGTVSIQNNAGLGSNNTTTVSSGATLAFDSTANGNLSTQQGTIVLNGSGSGSGALLNTAGSNQYNGVTTVASSATIAANNATTLTMLGNISSTAGSSTTLQFGTSSGSQGGNISLGGALNLGSSVGTAANVSKYGTGSLTLSTASASTIGSLTGNGGAISLGGGGTISAGGVTLTAGSLTLGSGTAMTTTGTAISGGSLSVSGSLTTNGTFNAASGTSLLIASGGTITVNGTGTIGGTLSNSSAGKLVVTGGSSLTFTSTGANISATSLELDLGGVGGTTYVYLGGLSSGATHGSLTVGTIHITGDTVLDFGNSAGTFLSSTNLIVDAGVHVTVANWTTTANDASNSTIWYLRNLSAPPQPVLTGSAGNQTLGGTNIVNNTPLNQITFSNPIGSVGGNTTWVADTSSGWFDHEIRPTPEPSTYGAIFMTGCLGFLGWRRYQRRKSERA